jgi:hypothetical protein
MVVTGIFLCRYCLMGRQPVLDCTVCLSAWRTSPRSLLRIQALLLPIKTLVLSGH